MPTVDNNTVKKTRDRNAVFQTHDGHKLTPAEAKFIDNYIETNNAQQSYIDAYPNTNPNNARQNAYRTLKKCYIASEINYRLEQLKSSSILTAEEILEYFSRVVKGEEKDQFGLEVSISERTRAATELAKRLIDIPNRTAGNEQPELKISLNWARAESATSPVQIVDAELITKEDDGK